MTLTQNKGLQFISTHKIKYIFMENLKKRTVKFIKTDIGVICIDVDRPHG